MRTNGARCLGAGLTYNRFQPQVRALTISPHDGTEIPAADAGSNTSM